MMPIKPVEPIQGVRTMSLVQLRDRLSDMIEENEKCGFSERNNCPVVVQLRGNPVPGELVDHDRRFLINYGQNAMVGLPEGDVIELIASTAGELGASLNKGRHRRRARGLC